MLLAIVLITPIMNDGINVIAGEWSQQDTGDVTVSEIVDGYKTFTQIFTEVTLFSCVCCATLFSFFGIVGDKFSAIRRPSENVLPSKEFDSIARNSMSIYRDTFGGFIVGLLVIAAILSPELLSGNAINGLITAMTKNKIDLALAFSFFIITPLAAGFILKHDAILVISVKVDGSIEPKSSLDEGYRQEEKRD